MNKQNLAEHIQVIDISPVEDLLATAEGDAIDLKMFDGDLAIVLDAVNVAGTDPTLDVIIEDSDTDVAEDFEAIDGAEFETVTDADPSVQKLNLNKDELKRFIRVIKTVGGTDDPEFLLSVKGYAFKKYQ